MIDGYRQVNLRVSTLEQLNKVREDNKLKSVDACVKFVLSQVRL